MGDGLALDPKAKGTTWASDPSVVAAPAEREMRVPSAEGELVAMSTGAITLVEKVRHAGNELLCVITSLVP